jgi:head decoration protein D
MAETHTPDNLKAGAFPQVGASGTIVSGAGSLPRGRVLGKITAGTVPSTGTLVAGGAADGTLTVVTGGVKTKPGIYTAICVEAVTNGGVFNILDPDGVFVTTVMIVAGAGGTGIFVTPQLNGTITDGANDFELGDYFTVTVPAGSGKLTSVDSTAIDGSAAPVAVLLEAKDATAADKVAPTALTGEFDDSVLTYGGSDTNATHVAAMRALSMFQKTTSLGGLSI